MCVCVCVCVFVCARVHVCAQNIRCLCGFWCLTVFLCTYVNNLCVKMSTCIRNLLLSSFKEVITHQAQEPTMREFCPSGSSCYDCAHDLSLSLNIVSMNAAQSLKTEETTCTQGVKNLSPMRSYPVVQYRPFYVWKTYAKFHSLETRVCTNHGLYEKMVLKDRQ